VGASASGSTTTVRWEADATTARIAIQARNGGSWRTVKIGPVGARQVSIARADAIAVTAIDRFGNTSPPKVLALR
jgi:hypothetical protein